MDIKYSGHTFDADSSAGTARKNAFSDVLRSSAIFYVRQEPGFKTTLSLMNYWKEKRDLEVAIVASVRRMDGGLIDRSRLDFLDGMVVNFEPNLQAAGETEGSVEIEVFSVKDLVVPYPAVMAIYESTDGICAVHSYSRAYSRFEEEDGAVVDAGEETNWTLRDNDTFRSFCVFHNGPEVQPAQNVKLKVLNGLGKTRTVEIPIGDLYPYQSVRIRPSDHVAGLVDFLGGASGQATLSFRVRACFTRMLVGNESHDGSDFQATHSDFNFNTHRAGFVSTPYTEGVLRVPNLNGMDRWVIVYPEQEPGAYQVTYGGESRTFKSGEFCSLPSSDDSMVFKFKKVGGHLPTRLNVGIGCSLGKGRLPSEPSLGIVHKETPPKRFTWAPCSAQDSLGTRIIVHPYTEIYGETPDDILLSFRLYGAKRDRYLECVLRPDALDGLDAGTPLRDIFPEAEAYLDGEFGYFVLFSNYPGLKAYITLTKANSVTLEHCF